MYKSILMYSAMFALTILFTGCGNDSTGPDKPKATTGTLTVTTTTSGPDQDADGYLLTIDGKDEQPADTSGTVTFEELSEGSHKIQLSGNTLNCAVEGETSQTAKVTAGDTTSVRFSISCEATLRNKIVFVGYKGEQSNLYVALDGTIPPSSFLGQSADDVRQAHPDVFPDGTKVAYEAGGNIWTVNADGKGKKQLTKKGEDHAPSACADGSIVFTSRREGVSQLYIMNADGSEQTAVTTKDPVYEASCPEGENPLYEGKDKSGPIVAARMNSGAEAQIVIIDAGIQRGNPVLKHLTDNNYFEGDPAWTPDGKSLVIVQEQKKGIFNLATISAETGEIQEQSDFEPGYLDGNASPSVSPDGKQILFTSIRKAKHKLGHSRLQSSDYNASRSNRTYNNGITNPFGGGGDGFTSIMDAVYSPRWK